jgi:hypothetical protein
MASRKISGVEHIARCVLATLSTPNATPMQMPGICSTAVTGGETTLLSGIATAMWNRFRRVGAAGVMRRQIMRREITCC